MHATRSIKRTRDDLIERRAAAAQRAREQIDILRTASALRRQEAAVEALDQLLGRGRLVFGTLADLSTPQVWVTNRQGAVLGHLLTVDAAAYGLALDADAYEVWSLAEVMAQPWEDLDAQATWVAIYAAVLDDERHAAEKRLEKALWQRGLLELVPDDKKRQEEPKHSGF